MVLSKFVPYRGMNSISLRVLGRQLKFWVPAAIDVAQMYLEGYSVERKMEEAP